MLGLARKLGSVVGAGGWTAFPAAIGLGGHPAVRGGGTRSDRRLPRFHFGGLAGEHRRRFLGMPSGPARADSIESVGGRGAGARLVRVGMERERIADGRARRRARRTAVSSNSAGRLDDLRLRSLARAARYCWPSMQASRSAAVQADRARWSRTLGGIRWSISSGSTFVSPARRPQLELVFFLGPGDARSLRGFAESR